MLSTRASSLGIPREKRRGRSARGPASRARFERYRCCSMPWRSAPPPELSGGAGRERGWDAALAGEEGRRKEKEGGEEGQHMRRRRRVQGLVLLALTAVSHSLSRLLGRGGRGGFPVSSPPAQCRTVRGKTTPGRCAPVATLPLRGRRAERRSTEGALLQPLRRQPGSPAAIAAGHRPGNCTPATVGPSLSAERHRASRDEEGA